MIHLIDVNEENWFEIINLRVSEEQQKYLDRPILQVRIDDGVNEKAVLTLQLTALSFAPFSI